jgi:RNA polymerase sigma-70 factor (ECF subfamily)
MMRVTRIPTSDGVATLRVEGRLTRHTAEELRAACDAARAGRRGLRLDVSGLQFLDPAGVALLRGLERGGAALAGRSGFVDELLRDGRDAAPADPDAALVARLRAGDADAYERLVREHGGRMLAAARRLLRSEDDARDAVQEAFVAAFRAIDGFAGGARLSTWLHRIVLNAALMKLRSRRRRREEPLEPLLPQFAEDGHFAEPPAAWDAAADELLQRRETRALVRDAIARLPEAYRTVLVLRDLEELGTDEAAAALGVTPNTVKTRLHRARQALRALLARDLAAPAPADARARA